MKNFIVSFLFCFLICSCSTESEKVEINEKGVKNKLTLMVYMAADNDLESYALANLRAMEQADYDGVKVLVLLDRAEGYDETEGNWTDTRLFEVCHADGSDSSIKSRRLNCPPLGLSASSNTELDMANPSVLKGFIDFSKASYEAEKYALIMWGHGNGWRAVSIDDKSLSFMSVYSLGQVLHDQELCVIGFDTCFGGVIENVYELKDCSEYTVACPGVTPNTGWNYKSFFEALSGEAENITSKSIAQAMAESAPVNTSIFENQKMNEVMAGFEDFCKTLSESIKNAADRNLLFDTLFSSKSYSYSQYPCDMYLDIGGLADLYSSDSDTRISQSAVKLKSLLPETGGLGVHFIPLTAAHTAATSHSSDYIKNQNLTDQCAFIKESQWWAATYEGKSASLLDKLFYSGL